MIGYGMAKAAIHQLTKSLASSDSGLPTGVKTYALLPITLGKRTKLHNMCFMHNWINERL